MPESDGRCLRKAVNASRPPADAPTPTIGNEFSFVSGLLIAGDGTSWAVFLACGCPFACDAALARITECLDPCGIFFAMQFFPIATARRDAEKQAHPSHSPPQPKVGWIWSRHRPRAAI